MPQDRSPQKMFTFWKFNFNGRFKKTASENAGREFYSNCFVPEAAKERAKRDFLVALQAEEIELISIDEEMSLRGDDIDFDDDENLYWIQFYREMEREGQAVFDVFHIVPDE